MAFNLLKNKKIRKKKMIALSKSMPLAREPDRPKTTGKLAKWIERYKVQVYSIMLVIIVAILASLAIYGKNLISYKISENFVGLSMPVFSLDDAEILEYDIDFSEISIDAKAKAYRLDASAINKATSAASKLGFMGSPEEYAYDGYYKWSKQDGEDVLIYNYKNSEMLYEGSYDSGWINSETVLSGIADLFGVNESSFYLAGDNVGSEYGFWVYGCKVGDTSVVIGKDDDCLVVVSDGKGIVSEITISVLEPVDSKSLPLLKPKELASGFDSLSKQVKASVFSGDDPEFNYLPISNPSGRFILSSSSIVLYKPRAASSFLVPVLELKGSLVTDDGSSGLATILVDIVDWEKL